MGVSLSTPTERNRRSGRERRLKTRARLLEAAIEVISGRGLELPVIDDFIARAAVSRGSFYNHFRTKDELLTDISDQLRQDLVHSFEISKLSIKDPAERLACGVRHIIHRSQADPRWALLLLHIRPKINKVEAAFRAGPRRDIANAVGSGRLPRQDVETAVDFVMGAAIEAVRAVISLPRPEDYAEQAATMILRGLGLRASEASATARRAMPDLSVS